MKEGVIGGTRPTWKFDETMKTQKFAPFIIPPKSNILGGGIGFTLGLLRMNIIAAGIIKYGDIFGDRHLTEYCYDFINYAPIDWDNYPAGQSIRISGATVSQGCDKHNCEDEECGPDWQERAK